MVRAGRRRLLSPGPLHHRASKNQSGTLEDLSIPCKANSVRATSPVSLRATAILLTVFMFLAACDGTEGELVEALNADEHTKLCVAAQTIGVDYFEADDGKRYFAKVGDISFFPASSNIDALPALRKKGYANNAPTTLPSGFATHIVGYAVTDKFTPYIGEFEQLCIGDMHATDIIDYTEPPADRPQYVQVRFRYKIRFNKLVEDLDIEDELVNGPIGRQWTGEGLATYVKTDKGWRIEMAHWVGI